MLSSIEFSEKIFASADREEIWQHCQSYFEQFGFDGLIYLDAKQDEVDFLSNFPQYWVDHYVDQGYEKIDPFLSYCCRSDGLTLTGADFLNRYNYLTAGQRNLINEASETGYAAGFAAPFRVTGPQGAGGWNFLSEMSATDVEKTVEEHGTALHMAGMFAHTALSDCPKTHDCALTPREKEALTWLASGLRGQQIAHKMGLASVTVEFHLKNERQNSAQKRANRPLRLQSSRARSQIRAYASAGMPFSTSFTM